MHRYAAVSLSLAFLVTPVLGQVAPQPPKAPQQEELASPPPPRPAPAPRPVIQPRPAPKPLPAFNIPEPIIKDGQYWFRPEPTDLLTLGFNPVLTPDVVAKLAPLLSDRRKQMQDLLLANPENTEQMLSPTFTMIDLKDPSTLTQAQAVLAPLRDIGPISVVLNSSGVLDTTARQLSQQITSGYQQKLIGAVREATPVDPDEDPSTNASQAAVGQIVFEYAISEPKFAFGLLAARVFEDLDAAFKAVDISPASVALLRESAPTVAAQTSIAQRADTARMAFANLTIVERQALANYAATLRTDADFTMPETGTSFRAMTDEERTQALIAAYGGSPFDWSKYVQAEASASDD